MARKKADKVHLWMEIPPCKNPPFVLHRASAGAVPVQSVVLTTKQARESYGEAIKGSDLVRLDGTVVPFGGKEE